MQSIKPKAVVAAAALALAMSTAARAGLTFNVDPGSPWPTGWYAAAVANMQTVVNEYNAYGDFGNGSIYVYYNAGIPTAQSGYGASGGSIGVGGTYPNVRVLLHESSHWLGTGTYSAYWQGSHAGALIQQFDGVGAVLNGDTQHYWPYGENYDSESSPVNDLRHVAMVYALREDFGIGSTAAPSTATSVTMTASDAVGASGFNYSTTWSDGHFPQPGTTYSTGNFTLRTPLDSNTPTGTTPSFNFVGDSLAVNNTNGVNGGLLFKGVGTSSVLTLKNLILDGGYVRHASGSGDLLQIAGKVTLNNAPTIDAAQGNIKIAANIVGSGSLTKAGGFTLTLTGNASYGGSTTINGGTLRLASIAPVASYTFDNVSGSTVVNGGSGGTGMNGTLANGAVVVAGGQSGNAVSLASGASVDINNPIMDLGSAGNWTVSAWVKTTTAGSSILSKGAGGWSSGNTILYLGDGSGPGSGGIPSAVRWGGGFVQGSTGATAVTNNAWHQVTYVNSAGTYGIYVDGVAQPLSAGNSAFANGDIGSIVRLGVSTNTVASDGTVNFNGLMDNVQFYNQALTGAQVQSVYQGGNISGALPSTTNVTIVNGAALDVNGVMQQIGSLTGAAGSAVKLGAGQLNVSSSASTSFAGVISGAGGSLVKSGTGTLTLGNVNTYTGPTTILGGTLRLSTPSAVAAATPVASYSFSHLSGNTVINDGSGGAGMNGTLNLNGGSGAINSNAGPGAGLGALVLNGNGTTVDINSGVADLGSGSNWTVSAWVKTTQAGATIFNKGDGSTWNSGFSTFYLGTGADAGSGALPDAVRWGGAWLAGSTPVNDGKWHLLTFTDAAASKSIYVDGALESLSQSQFNNADAGSKIRIGFAPTNVDGEVPTSGSLSGINIYNAALSAAQVAALYSTVLGATMPLPAGTDMTLAGGAMLDVNGVTQQVASLSGPAGAAVTLGAGQLIVGSASNTQFAGVISGAGGSLAKIGAGTLTLSGANTYTGGTSVSAGALTIDAAGSMASSSYVVAAGATLNINGGVAATTGINSSGTVNIAGNTSATTNGARSVGGILVNPGGLVALLPSVAASHPLVLTAGGLTLSGATAKFDLTNNELVVTDNLTNVRAEIVAGSLKTSTAGLAVGSLDLGNGTVEARATLLGDTNLDGAVDVTDLGNLASSYGSGSGALWVQGDTNYDGAVDVTDLGNLASNYGGALASGPSVGPAGAMIAASTASLADGAAVPEPGSIALLGMGAIVLLTRRVRRRISAR